MCVQNTETADFLGGLRPIRGKDQISLQFRATAKEFFRVTGSAPPGSDLHSTPLKDLVHFLFQTWTANSNRTHSRE